MFRPTIDHLENLSSLSKEERTQLKPVVQRFPLKISEHYLSLIDWSDPHDPIRRIIIPRADELEGEGELDPSCEATNTVLPGLQHKYPHTVLLLCHQVCAGACRFCFRKRVFMGGNSEISPDVSAGLDYIRRTSAVTNVLLTGGDPLLMPAGRLEAILRELRGIDHVGIIRIGSKVPAFDPGRILEDLELQEVLHQHTGPEKRIYLMAHFDHPHELHPKAVAALDLLLRLGVIVVNQCPLLAGINDDPVVLAQLFRKLSFIGVPPYYLFQCRPTIGNRSFQVPLVRGYSIFQAALANVSGLAKRARFVKSHAHGKIEIVGLDDLHIYMRYHRAKDPANDGRFMVFHRDDKACWLDELKPVDGLGAARALPTTSRNRNHGPE